MNGNTLVVILAVIGFLYIVKIVIGRPRGPNPVFFDVRQSPFWYESRYWRPRYWGTKRAGVVPRFGLAGPPMPGPMR